MEMDIEVRHSSIFIGLGPKRADTAAQQAHDKPAQEGEALALRLGQNGVVEVYLGHNDTIYTDKYLRSDRSAEHWLPLKDSQIVFYQTVLSIANTIDEYMA